MRYGIFSDVHGNLEAFSVVRDYYAKEKIDTFIYLGDIVGYGADPQACIEILKTLEPLCIAGNHEWAVTDKLGQGYFNSHARAAIAWTRKNLRKSDIAYLRSFKLNHTKDDFVCTHGTINNPQEFNYIWNTDDAAEDFLFLSRWISFIGHSHKTEVYFKKNNRTLCSRGLKTKLNRQAKYIINVGSVGQPRDGDPRASLCIYDSGQGTVAFERLEYDVKTAAEKILRRGLPSILASRLYRGW